MKNTQYRGPRLPPDIQVDRLRKVIWSELSEAQRDVLIDYYYHSRNIPTIAAQRGVNKSTVCRTLHRAEKNLCRYLQY